MIEIILFAILGVAIGIFFGLVPGLHPNFLILLAPLLFAFAGSPENLVVFAVSMAVANAISDFLPSILFGAPEEGTELSVMPGHRMLLDGRGYEAVKLAATGGLLSVFAFIILFPIISFSFPLLYEFIHPVLFSILSLASAYMILAGSNKILAAFCFFAAGIVGLSLHWVPLDPTLSLFPVFSGLFGAAVLIPQFKIKKAKIKPQKSEEYVSSRLVNRASLFGSIGGIFSGLLPGIGPSQVASVASVDKNEKSFLVTIGALSVSNIVMSVISLWLIGQARSGVAVMLEGFVSVTFSEVLLIIFAALFSAGIAVIITLKLAKISLNILEKFDYAMVSKIIFIFIVMATALSTGFVGILLFSLCMCIGLFAYLSQVRMSCLMGVLLVPTIIFYLPI